MPSIADAHLHARLLPRHTQAMQRLGRVAHAQEHGQRGRERMRGAHEANRVVEGACESATRRAETSGDDVVVICILVECPQSRLQFVPAGANADGVQPERIAPAEPPTMGASC